VTTIRSLRPNVTEAEAVQRFRGGLGALLPWVGGGRLRSLAAVYLPFQLYQVEIAHGPRRQTSWFALDAVSGALDLYRFEQPPGGDALVEVETRNRPEPRLAEAIALSLLEEKLRRAVFQAGFFRVRDLSFRVERSPLALHVPYWVGFYGRPELRRLRVMDAVRRRFEGGKARALFEDWLAGAPPP
jgi:hypothetical protein